MTLTVPTCEPTELTIGSAWAWDPTYPDFPADDSWELTYYLVGPEGFTLAWGTHVAAGDGAEFEVRVTAAQQTTAGFDTAGVYRLVGRVSKSGSEFDNTVTYDERLRVFANPATSVATDAGTSFNRQMLAAIEAALLAGVSSSAEAKVITINGRSIQYRDGADLEGRRAHYALLVAIEERDPDACVFEEVYASRA